METPPSGTIPLVLPARTMRPYTKLIRQLNAEMVEDLEDGQ
jgi:hypothetical protein